MATYEEIYGKRVDVLDADPTLNSSYEGQVWYNSTTGELKSVVSFSAWTSIAGQINAYPQSYGGGTTDAGWIAGGYSPGPTKQNRTEEFNGSGWSAGGNLNTARVDIMGAGLQTAAVAAMGDNSPDSPRTMTNTEEYNGTAWTNQNTSPGGMFENCGSCCGTEPAYMAVGGRSGPPQSRQTTTMEYDGTNWSTAGAYPAALSGIYVSGTQTAAIGSCGEPPPPAPAAVNTSAEYNGASWTAVATSPFTRRSGGRSGTQTAALFFGGSPGTPAGTATLTYDGTTFATDPASLATPMGGQASSTNSPGTTAWSCNPNQVVEEYNKSINTITAGAWSSAPSLNTTRAYVGRSGIAPTQNAAMCVSGYPGPPSTVDVKNVEEFDGTSWTEIADVNSQRYGGMCAGTTTAGLFFGGNSDVTPWPYKPTPLSEEWNGTSWTEGPNMNDGNESGGALGTQTAALQSGGSLNPYPNYTNTSEEYNGASWTNVPATIFASVSNVTGVGTQTAGLIFCGNETPPPGTNYATAQTYNGTAYTTVNSCVETGNKLVGGGTQTAAFGAGGGPGSKSRVQHYDGTTWSTVPSLGTGRSSSSGGAPQTAGIYFAGNPGSGGSTTATEQFTAGSTTVAAKTLTTS